MVIEQRCSRWFDCPGNMRSRIRTAQSSEEGQGTSDIANRTEKHDQNTLGGERRRKSRHG